MLYESTARLSCYGGGAGGRNCTDVDLFTRQMLGCLSYTSMERIVGIEPTLVSLEG